MFLYSNEFVPLEFHVEEKVRPVDVESVISPPTHFVQVPYEDT